jgi:hypothetical protein
MQKEQSIDRPGLVKRSMGVLKTGPDVSTAAHNGPPTMTPASESGDETIGFSLQPNANAASTSSVGNTATVETVTPGSSDALPVPADTTPATDTTPTTTDSAQPASTTTPAPPANTNQESTSKKKSGLRKIIPF